MTTSRLQNPSKRHLWLLSVAIFVCACNPAQQNSHLTIQQKQHMEDQKQQVISFLGRLKTALDLNVIGDPRRLQEVTGFEVLEWKEATQWTPKYAERWRYNVPVMDQAPEMLGITDLYRTGYRPADNSSYPGGIGIGGFPTIACISPANMNQIFGAAHLDARMRARPHFDQPWIAPFWDVNGYIPNSKTGSLLTLTYHYEDEKEPKATCLAQLGIAYGLKPPAGYWTGFFH